MLEELEAVTPPQFARGLRYERHKALGNIALAEGRFDAAIREYRESASRPQDVEPMALLAFAFDQAGQADSARAYYRSFIQTPNWIRVITDDLFLGPALERLAELEDEAGDLEAAARYYAEFVELWANADPELQHRVATARARLEEILAERG